MHSSTGQHGGDLNTDTITIIGATLDLQEKVVRQVRAALVDSPHIFHLLDMMHLGHDTDQRRLHALTANWTTRPRKICATGHSVVPVYEEVEVPTSGVIEARNKAGSGIVTLPSSDMGDGDGKTMMVKRIVGIFLVKQVGDVVTRPNWCMC